VFARFSLEFVNTTEPALNVPFELAAIFPSQSFTSSIYAAKSAIAVKAAEPMAKPLPVAAVVLPSISSSSVRLRTSGGKPLISALPPALSAMGPKASVARVTPRVESIPTAAKLTP